MREDCAEIHVSKTMDKYTATVTTSTHVYSHPPRDIYFDLGHPDWWFVHLTPFKDLMLTQSRKEGAQSTSLLDIAHNEMPQDITRGCDSYCTVGSTLACLIDGMIVLPTGVW